MQQPRSEFWSCPGVGDREKLSSKLDVRRLPRTRVRRLEIYTKHQSRVPRTARIGRLPAPAGDKTADEPDSPRASAYLARPQPAPEEDTFREAPRSRKNKSADGVRNSCLESWLAHREEEKNEASLLRRGAPEPIAKWNGNEESPARIDIDFLALVAGVPLRPILYKTIQSKPARPTRGRSS